MTIEATGREERSQANEAMLETAFLYGGNAAWIEALHAQFVEDPASVDASWRDFFTAQAEGGEAARKAARGPEWRNPNWPRPANGELVSAMDGNWGAVETALKSKIEGKAKSAPAPGAPAAPVAPVQPGAVAAALGLSPEQVNQQVRDSVRALMMIRAYRMRGHLAANLDPLGLEERPPQPELDPASYGFGPADMDRRIYIDNVLGLEYATPRQMVDILKRTYCGTFALEFMHISDPEEKAWLQARIEGESKEITFTREGKRAILHKLLEAETFERFIHKRFPGTKRFGLDGGEAAVPALEQIIKRGGALGVSEIVLGMPHRGRLNVLAAVMGKPYHKIFNEFQGGNTQDAGEYSSGDVKYHLGASSDRVFDGNTVHLSLTANPSHLEAVDPVVLGKVRAKQSFLPISDRKELRAKVMPLLMHGDAAFAGQGVVSECLALSGLTGYRTGGCVHFIINNQIGFTTAPRYSRSSPYPSDVALQVQAPIFHVNGDDPEAVVHAAKVATEYRQKFGKDVVIDMFCYRRFGHNEGDDPTMTQPLMYKVINGRPSTRELYSRRLIEQGVIDQAALDKEISEMEAFLDAELQKGKTFKPDRADWLDGKWSGLGLPKDDEGRGQTAVAIEKLRDLGDKITRIPANFDMHKTVARVVGNRRAAIEAGHGIDWALAEHLAFATLLDEGFPVRLSGQDSCRGTFTQRHSHFVNQTNEERYTPLNNLGPAQATYEVIDSLLSEEAVLGYEYGYSLAAPNTLVLWEAQFGDFANGAQVVFDQFISAGERKWLRMSGLVCLLPHGYEGQGPEHSSARLERFLQMCAQDNLQVANCSTPANYFHALRRQIHRDFRKPLILMTPKSLLRHKRCVSALADLGPGTSFHRVLLDDAEMSGRQADVRLKPDADIRRVVLCTGKVYYDLFDEREKRKADDVYLLRVEQLYPFPVASLMKELARFPKADVVWCQEEPRNMGGWNFVDWNIEATLRRLEVASKRARYVGRPASASTAAGTMELHNKELAAFLEAAFEK